MGSRKPLSDILLASEPGELVLDFHGFLTEEVILGLLNTLEGRLINEGVAIGLQKKVFNVFTEAIQNVYHHQDVHHLSDTTLPSADTDAYVGLFCDDKGRHMIRTVNLVLNSRKTELEEKINLVNALSADELRFLHKESLSKASLSEKGGAGLGLIDLARKSGNPLDYCFVDLNETFSYFILTLTVG